MDIQIAHLQSFWKEAQTRKSSIHGHGKIRHSSKGVKSNVHFPKSCQKSDCVCFFRKYLRIITLFGGPHETVEKSGGANPWTA